MDFYEEELEMAVNLETTPDCVDIDSSNYAALLRNLQANILWAHGRNFARHIFLRFTGSPDDVKTWIRDSVAILVTTAKQQNEQINERRKDKTYDGGLVCGFFLSAEGFKFLGFDTEQFASGAFRKGMKDQTEGFLRHIVTTVTDTNNKDPKPETWEAGFQETIHALLTFADASEGQVIKAAEAIRTSVAKIGQVLTIEEGTVLRRKNAAAGGSPESVEHFGYFDGISNPLFTKQDLDEELPENKERVNWDAGARLSLVLVDDPFSEEADTFGSYLVYRKLGQNFNLFNERVLALASSLKIDPELAGAMVVGRFKDGTPVALADTPSAGAELANDFNFQEDPDGMKCPIHSHIRKVNPRGTTPLTSLDSERKRRIVRRGIPYGEPMPGVSDSASVDPCPDAARGLLFMCFQQNVEEQFEFIQRTWVDNEHFPKGVFSLGLLGDTGDDPLIGQDEDETQRWPKKWGSDGGKKAFNFESAVTLKGGEYFFAPSIPFLKAL